METLQKTKNDIAAVDDASMAHYTEGKAYMSASYAAADDLKVRQNVLGRRGRNAEPATINAYILPTGTRSSNLRDVPI